MYKYIVFCIILILAVTVSAQVELNGSVDFEVAYGGKDSKFITNEVASEFRRPHLSISQLNLFTFAQISDAFSINARIQWDTWGTGKMNQVRITLAMLTYEPLESAISFSVGRFISPFGLYPKRQLAADNLFAHSPLAYGYFVNVSETRGFWPKAGDSGIYLADDVGLTTVYFGGYNTGALFSWILVPELLNLDLAITNAAVSSQADHTNLLNGGGIIHLGFQPVIYWQQGISASFGTFMQRDDINSNLQGLEKFNQIVLGTDIILAHSYFELSGEFIYSMWNVPGFANGTFKESASGELGEFNIDNYSAYVDFKYEPPFFTGSYIAFRYDMMKFLEFDHPATSSVITKNPWDTDVMRYSAAFGYKFDRSILLKLTYTDQKLDISGEEPDLKSIRGILTVSF